MCTCSVGQEICNFHIFVYGLLITIFKLKNSFYCFTFKQFFDKISNWTDLVICQTNDWSRTSSSRLYRPDKKLQNHNYFINVLLKLCFKWSRWETLSWCLDSKLDNLLVKLSSDCSKLFCRLSTLVSLFFLNVSTVFFNRFKPAKKKSYSEWHITLILNFGTVCNID